MPLETANYINQLNPANPLSTDSVSQSDDHLRTIKLALKNTFPNLDGPVLSTPAQLNSPVPVGVILMWSGAIVAIPAGYALCDGTNGTPDLRKRFVYGANSTDNPVGTIGGSASTGMAGSHTHTINGATAGAPGVTLNAVQSGTGATAVTAVAAPANHTHTANLVGDHQHTSLPPYMALAYIMKV
jgi:hypothetical protein